jgi:hypothetical protein
MKCEMFDEKIDATPAALTAEQIKAAERARIAEQTKAFLASGGRITVVEPYKNAQHVEAIRPMTQQEDLALKKRLRLKASTALKLFYRPEKGMWQADFALSFLGLFASQEEAAQAIKAKADEMFKRTTVTRHKLVG